MNKVQMIFDDKKIISNKNSSVINILNLGLHGVYKIEVH